MKRKILLSIFAIVVIASSSNAQTFIASFGIEQSWGVPHRVSHYIDNHYYGYNWVHAKRVAHHGSYNFEVVLQRGDVFIEVSLDPFGNVYRTVRRDYYPLYEHVCGSYCGYHTNYYQANYYTCNSHSHSGHNHVNYYHQPKGYAYGYYKNQKHHHGNHYSKSNHYSNHKEDRKSNYNDRYPTRRGEYHKERYDDHGHRDSDKSGSKYHGKSNKSNSGGRYEGGSRKNNNSNGRSNRTSTSSRTRIASR
ncbi:MAG: hypothetical protein OEW67_08530 [Cyclobacteriaceae bacterium]|nr:hypothetical protein [Cyclobacteriaceae bacterium]